nr:glycosyltransferase [uncultured Acetatifactor sp.]
MHKEYIIYDPFWGLNAYIENMKKCWGELYKVVSFSYVEDNICMLLNTKAIILNWIECDLSRKKMKQLVWFKMLGIKIIWVFHNRIPHDSSDNIREIEKTRKKMGFIAKISDVIILHSYSSWRYLKEYTVNGDKAFYIPHVDYMRQVQWARDVQRGDQDDFKFVFQGAISPYKNLELLVKVFRELNLPNCQLHIIGKPCSTEYAEKISRLSVGAKIYLKWEWISDYAVGQEIQKGDVMVLPYDLKSSMNSGAMIAAFSNKRTVIVCANAMAQDFREEDFLYIYDYSNQESHYCQLKAAMKLAYENGVAVNRAKGEKAFEYIRRHNSEEIVVKRLKKMVKERL